MNEPRQYYYESGQGRFDRNDVEWWKCDGIGRHDWFRWHGRTLIRLDTAWEGGSLYWQDPVTEEHRHITDAFPGWREETHD